MSLPSINIHNIPPNLPPRSRAALMYMLSVRAQLQAANQTQLYTEFLTIFRDVHDARTDMLTAVERIVEIMAYAGCPELVEGVNSIFDVRVGYRVECTATHVVITKPSGTTKIPIRRPNGGGTGL
ncbi:hypothetical protein AURDEDRAFT_165193 [Auricularia subglabra TFB-10046 SS5]|nr:hypothetical protein AURDEDRAFT_165193 [Auricularia subglabra TFB-10046 SS5]